MSKAKSVIDAVIYYGGSDFVKGRYEQHHTHVISIHNTERIGTAYASDIGMNAIICGIKTYNQYIEDMSTNYGRSSHRELITWQAELKEAKEAKVDYTSEEFWKDAPEGATHWDNLADCFCKKEGYWHSNNVNRYVEHDDQNMWGDPSRYESRPKPSPVFTKAMSDAGELPQVGMEVEVNNCGNIYNYDVLFISDQYFIGTDGINEQHFHTSSIKIKPIDTRTDKEKAIDDIAKAGGFYSSKDSMVVNIFNDIESGKIHGVTWSGNNE